MGLGIPFSVGYHKGTPFLWELPMSLLRTAGPSLGYTAMLPALCGPSSTHVDQALKPQTFVDDALPPPVEPLFHG